MRDTFSRYGDVLYQSDTDDNTLSFTLAGGMLVSQHDAAGTSCFLSDALGSTRALTDEAGSISSAYDYDTFGELTAGSDPVGNDCTMSAVMRFCISNISTSSTETKRAVSGVLSHCSLFDADDVTRQRFVADIASGVCRMRLIL